jgi:hypothetical protein
MLAAVIEGPGAVVVRDTAPRAAGLRSGLPNLCARGGLFDAAIRLCADRRLRLAPLVTGRFPLSEVGAALAASGRPDQLKIVLDVTGR